MQTSMRYDVYLASNYSNAFSQDFMKIGTGRPGSAIVSSFITTAFTAPASATVAFSRI